MTLNDIDELSDNLDEPLLFADGFDDCLIGLAEGFGGNECLAYDKTKILAKLRENMSEEEAIEYFDFNIGGAYVGKRTPIFITLVNK
jgi:hypothetical protein